VAEASILSKDDLSIPIMEATPTPSIRPTEETKKASLLDTRKTMTISSSLNVK
jgi:hypothetical protein